MLGCSSNATVTRAGFSWPDLKDIEAAEKARIAREKIRRESEDYVSSEEEQEESDDDVDEEAKAAEAARLLREAEARAAKEQSAKGRSHGPHRSSDKDRDHRIN